jgi:ornithine cyclodeaminase/alanine dehydrogenase-like protein (mu-crystallin family)
MGDPPLRLRHRDMLRALDGIDVVDLVARELIRGISGSARPRTGPTADHAGVAAAMEMTAVEDQDTGRVCLLPTPSLHLISSAAVATLAARELLPPSVVTAAVLGSGPAARLQLLLIARYLHNVSSATVHPAALETDRSVEWNARDELDRAGITLTVDADPRHAALGANLLMIAELGWDRLDLGHLRPGVLVVNATRRDLPDELLAQVDRVYVDDLGLLDLNNHRTFVRLHRAEADDRQYEPREGWYRRQWRYQRRIDSDLGHVLVDGQKRTDVDDVLLVELLNGGSFDTWLAGHICRAAIELGLDLQDDDSE